MTNTLRLAAAAAVAALLAACGGGGSDPPATPAGPATVPDSATASVAAYTRFAGQLIADVNGSQTAVPLWLNAAAAPVSESAGPTAVD